MQMSRKRQKLVNSEKRKYVLFVSIEMLAFCMWLTHKKQINTIVLFALLLSKSREVVLLRIPGSNMLLTPGLGPISGLINTQTLARWDLKQNKCLDAQI